MKIIQRNYENLLKNIKYKSYIINLPVNLEIEN